MKTAEFPIKTDGGIIVENLTVIPLRDDKQQKRTKKELHYMGNISKLKIKNVQWYKSGVVFHKTIPELPVGVVLSDLNLCNYAKELKSGTIADKTVKTNGDSLITDRVIKTNGNLLATDLYFYKESDPRLEHDAYCVADIEESIYDRVTWDKDGNVLCLKEEGSDDWKYPVDLNGQVILDLSLTGRNL